MNKKLCFSRVMLIAVSTSAYKFTDDILARMNMQASTAQNFILGNFTGHFDYRINAVEQDETDWFRIPYSKKLLPAIVSGDQQAAAKELCKYIKMYCSSKEFEKAYNKQRLSSLPLTDNGADVSVILHDIEVYQTNIDRYKSDAKYVAEQQQLKNEQQEKLNKLLDKAKGAFPLKKEWETTYPADPAVMIRKRLQEYLSLVATVDFDAKLSAADKYNKRKFIHPAYEKQSLKWKAIYRAGKEVNDVVTVFVKDWLKGEIISKEKITMSTGTTKGKQAETANNEVANKSTMEDSGSGNVTTPAAPVKEKKALLNKLKNKAKSIIN